MSQWCKQDGFSIEVIDGLVPTELENFYLSPGNKKWYENYVLLNIPIFPIAQIFQNTLRFTYTMVFIVYVT